MSATNVPPGPTIREITVALASSSPRVREAVLSVHPPEPMDPQSLKIVLEAVREKEAEARGGVDVKV